MKRTILDGANSIGGNKIHVETGGVGVLLDFGLNCSKSGRYYEEFLQPRGTRGIYDLLALDLVPRISGLYRDDLHPEGFKIADAQSLSVDAILVSHAHMDHTGHISFLRHDISIHCSGMTAVIMKAIQDCGQAAFDKEIAYISPRVCSGGTIKSQRVLKELRKVEVFGSDDLSRLNEFWGQSFSSSKINGPALEPAGSSVNGLSYNAFPVDHSILGATAFSINTYAGWIVYTGDLRMHGINAESTRAFIRAVKALKPKLLIVEGTNANEKTKNTEADVKKNCLGVFDEYKRKLVVADFSPRNIERLITFRDIAKSAGRRLVITAKDAFLLYAMHLADETVPDVPSNETVLIFEEVRGSERLWERDFLRASYGDKYIGPKDISKAQGDYILAFSFWDISHLIPIHTESKDHFVENPGSDFNVMQVEDGQSIEIS